MDWIRRQKSVSTYDPNTKHVLYGLDADLIMLALATHEPQFWILREEVVIKSFKDRACETCGQSGHTAFQCTGKAKEKVGQWDDQSTYLDLKPFLFVHISVLREYLEEEMKLLDIPFEWSVERAIDDWVFMCFFVGNDFLPHLPSLEIREGAVELLIGIWKKLAKNWDGYLTDSGNIDLNRVQIVMEELGKVEDRIFMERRDGDERRRLARVERKKDKNSRGQNGNLPSALLKSSAYIQEQMAGVESFSVKNAGTKRAHAQPKFVPEKKPHFSHQNPDSAGANMAAAKKLKMQLMSKLKKEPSNPNGGLSMTDFQMEEPEPMIEPVIEIVAVPSFAQEEEEVESGTIIPVLVANEAIDMVVKDEVKVEDSLDVEEEEEEVGSGIAPVVHVPTPDSDDEAPMDDVRLWEEGWKARYYEKKFEVDVGNDEFRQRYISF